MLPLLIQIIIALIVAGFILWAARKLVALIPMEPLNDTDLMLGIAFNRRLTDDELRDLHDYIAEKYNFDWDAIAALRRA